jgi:hypothetical protein
MCLDTLRGMPGHMKGYAWTLKRYAMVPWGDLPLPLNGYAWSPEGGWMPGHLSVYWKLEGICLDTWCLDACRGMPGHLIGIGRDPLKGYANTSEWVCLTPQGLCLDAWGYYVWIVEGLRLDRSTARYIYRDNKIKLVDLSIHAQKEKCFFDYSTNTLFYKDLFLTILNCYNQDFVKSAIFQRKVLFF